ncbi:MAG: aromatic ring-hydroxylating dioxygenase subunit alpha [Novosphingobium sp.]|uniref:aromatic ring-hydroxylating oxygenase subunit alpha n=1 Tax=Novosphingobium sp. TaxID=1874826 RepID=UPI0032BDD301
MTKLDHAFAEIESRDVDPDADFSLPGWIYTDEEFLKLEVERILRPSWQIVCHVSEVAQPGQYQTLDYLGESVVVIRGDDGEVRAFTNVCRHRAMRLVEGPAGCTKKLVCPYHAWAYETDGRLTGVPNRREYPTLKLEENGLVPVGLEVWQGFIFVQLEDAGFPSVAEMMAPFDAEVSQYRFADMRSMGPVRLRPRGVNWKNVGDNYSDNLHIPIAHDGLSRLVGKTYRIEAHGWADRLYGDVIKNDKQNFWEKVYGAHLPKVDHLPQEAHGRWLYYKLWPNMAFDIYADQIDFMQWLPISPTECILREVAYAIPDDRREMKAVRYANWRINRNVNAEDTWLISRVQQGMASKSYGTGPIATSEVCLRSFAKKIRALIPQARQPFAPKPGWSTHKQS